jgi:uncharacterized protein YegP (UPF0339 family)
MTAKKTVKTAKTVKTVKTAKTVKVPTAATMTTATVPGDTPARWVVYKAQDGYRWKLVERNGHIIADSGEAYTRKVDARRAVLNVQIEAARAWLAYIEPTMNA